MAPADSVFAAGIQNEEANNTVHQNPPFEGKGVARAAAWR